MSAARDDLRALDGKPPAAGSPSNAGPEAGLEPVLMAALVVLGAR